MYFLDTNICIFHINGSAPKMSDKLENFRLETIKIPSMVAAELFYGAEKSQRPEENYQRCKEFISLFDVAAFDINAAAHYAGIRRSLEEMGKPIGGNDMIIAAITKANDGILVTNNTKEFSRVHGLNLEDWTQ
jgi:tRNA(fMet)-specific endonuclease VapC